MINREMNKEMRSLTAAVFRVTESFSSGEVLKNKIQEKALDIFAKSNPSLDSVMAKDINILKNFLGLARELGLTSSINCEVLIREYDRLLDFINTDLRKSKEIHTDTSSVPIRQNPHESVSNKLASIDLTERQQKIIKLFKNKKELRLKDISVVLSDVTSRTLRNDLRRLVERKLVINQGLGAGSVYKEVAPKI